MLRKGYSGAGDVIKKEDLKRVYRTETIEKAKENMERFCEQWERKYLKVVNRWIDNFLYRYSHPINLPQLSFQKVKIF